MYMLYADNLHIHRYLDNLHVYFVEITNDAWLRQVHREAGSLGAALGLRPKVPCGRAG